MDQPDPPRAPAPLSYASAQTPRLPNGAADASLFAGVAGLLLFAMAWMERGGLALFFAVPAAGVCGILAIITGIVGLRRGRRPLTAGRRNAVVGVVLGSVILAALVASAVVVARVLDAVDRGYRRMQLVQVDTLLRTWAADHNGQLPASLGDAANSSANFVYLGKGVHLPTAGGGQVLAYERPELHLRGLFARKGVFALLAGGQVQWIPASQIGPFLRALATPAPAPASRPSVVE